MFCVSELRGFRLMNGYRGLPPVDLDALALVVRRVGRLIHDLPEVAELDCNPVIATDNGLFVVDAKVRVRVRVRVRPA